MKTQIFKNYSEFLTREDKTLNGVSEAFAKEHPDFETQNQTNKGCWNCSHCSSCSDCSDCSHCSRCSSCSRCSHCSRCLDCSGCSSCSDCSDCLDCSRCLDCSGWVKNQPPFKMGEYPVIENIHQRVLEAITREGNNLRMESWHSDDSVDEKGAYCGTTHCRAGWVVALAGARGRELELHTSTPFAAMMIYKASSDIRVSPTRFYESNGLAMTDIIRCAEEEKMTKQNIQ